MSGDVRPVPEVEVTTAGTEREATRVEVTHQVPALGPAFVGVPGGLMAATADVVMPEQDDVTGLRRASPWDRQGGFPPAEGDTAVIDVDEQRRFTGVVERVGGGAYDDLEVGLVDRLDRLRHLVSFDPASTPMKGLTNSGRPRIELSLVHDPMLRVEHFVFGAARAAGYHAVPRVREDAALWVPMTGSLLPERGYGYLHQQATIPNIQWRTDAPWPGRFGANGLNAEWSTDADKPSVDIHHLDFAIQLARRGTGQQRIELIRQKVPGGVDRVVVFRLDVNFPTTSTIRVRASLRSSGSLGQVLDKTFPWDPANPWIKLAAFNGFLILEVSGSEEYPGTTTSLAVNAVSTAPVSGGGVTVGMVALSGNADFNEEVVRHDTPITAHITPSPLLTSRLEASPTVTRREALSLLQEIAEATMSDMWIDRDGHFHWHGCGSLDSQTYSATLTADADLLDITWQQTTRDVSREIAVRHWPPAIKAISRWAAVAIWDHAGGEEMNQGDVVVEWATPPPKEDWVAVDWPPLTVAEGGPINIHTSVGGRVGSSWATPAQLTIDSEQVNAEAYKFTHTAHVDGVTLATSSDKPLPWMRSFGKIVWGDDVTIAATRGPDYAADYEHNVTYWVQGDDVQTLADWIAGRMVNPRPIIRELPIVWRDDLELGQIVLLVEDAVYDIELRCLVIGIRERHTPRDGAEMWVTLRVLDAQDLPISYNFGAGPYGDGPYGGS